MNPRWIKLKKKTWIFETENLWRNIAVLEQNYSTQSCKSIIFEYFWYFLYISKLQWESVFFHQDFSLQLTWCHRVRRQFPHRLGGSDVQHLLLSNLLGFVASMFQVLLGGKKTFSNINISCHFVGLVRATTINCADFRKWNLLQIDSNVNWTNNLRKVINSSWR